MGDGTSSAGVRLQMQSGGVNDRRVALLEAGINVLGEHGVRAVTHRAVDAAAGLPAGSTSNHFRTRDALFDVLVVRLSERERRNWDELARRAAPTTGAELAAILSMYAIQATSHHRCLTLARYAILVESGSRPALRDQLLRTGAEVKHLGRALGAHHRVLRR